VPDGIDAVMDRVERALAHSACNGMSRNTEPSQLIRIDHTLLPRGERGDLPVDATEG